MTTALEAQNSMCLWLLARPEDDSYAEFQQAVADQYVDPHAAIDAVIDLYMSESFTCPPAFTWRGTARSPR